jgi:3-keto-5-aminohexanoate cleavage enzyme
METTTGVWEYTNPQEWLNRVAKGNLPPLIITVAITGGAHGKEINPNHPETAEEQAQQTCDCYNAGASMVHIHARQPANLSLTSGNAADYRRVNALIREKCPEIIIMDTSGGGMGVGEEEALASIEANPEVASIDMGPLAVRFFFKKRPEVGRAEDFEGEGATGTTFGRTEKFAKAMLEKGIKPEMEVWHSGQLWLVQNLIDKGLVKPPYLIQFVMGFQSGAYATPKEVLHLLESAPKPSVLFVMGVGHWQTSMITTGILLGINVRTGMEDNVLYGRGELCRDNAQLVERVVRVARELGREIATPKQARQMLGLSEKPSQY